MTRCAPTKLVIADMPFGSLQADVALNVEQSIRVFKDSGAGAFKMEGATSEILTTIRHLIRWSSCLRAHRFSAPVGPFKWL